MRPPKVGAAIVGTQTLLSKVSITLVRKPAGTGTKELEAIASRFERNSGLVWKENRVERVYTDAMIG
jgi:hypothetical protein